MSDDFRGAGASRGLSGSANLTVREKFVPDQPRCHGNENLKILTENWQ